MGMTWDNSYGHPVTSVVNSRPVIAPFWECFQSVPAE